MQARIRKKRSFTRAWWASRSQTTSIFSIVCLLVLSGCATRKIKNPTLLKSFSSICLTGQGKGRIEFAKGRHVFDYESLWQPKEDKWSLALGLPLIGQELLALSLKGKDFDDMASGTFANRLRNENKGPRTRRLLSDFFSTLVEFLNILKTKEVPKKSSEKWNFESTESDFQAKTSVGARYQFHMKAFQWNDHYERLQLSLKLNPKMKSKSKSRTLLKLDLFVGACNLK